MLRQLSFRFTPLHERRLRFQYTPSLQKVFQFTPLHKRRRLPLHRLASRRRYFNSRLYMRGNSCAAVCSFSFCVFQFTPLHERQQGQAETIHIRFIFQFTPLHERQRGGTLGSAARNYFNSRLYMRGNRKGRKNLLNLQISIHAST